jgi:Mn-containing catalase
VRATGYLLVRGGVHQVAYARALERLTGADLMKLFPSLGFRPTRSRSAGRTSNRKEHLSSTASRAGLPGSGRGLQRPAPGDRREADDCGRSAPDRRAGTDLPPRPDVFAPSYASEEIMEIAQKLRKKADPDRSWRSAQLTSCVGGRGSRDHPHDRVAISRRRWLAPDPALAP